MNTDQAKADIEEAKAGILAALAHNPWPVIAGALVLGFAVGALLL